MPGIYKKNKFDLAGFSTGIVPRNKILKNDNVKNGDIILAVLLLAFTQMVIL